MVYSKSFIQSIGTYRIAMMLVLVLGSGSIKSTPADSIIFRAIVDEVERNMKEIQYKDFARPFFISFTLQDIHTLYVDASFGAIVNCREKHDRSWANRVLCGSYRVNDENYYDATRTKASGDGTLSLPLDTDYWGIRRAIWLIINNTYKSAAQTYQNKIEALKEKNFPYDSLQIPDFAIAPSIRLTCESEVSMPSLERVKDFVRSLSQRFNDKKKISYSIVSYYQIQAKIYFYSSENTQIIVPFDYSILNIGVMNDSSLNDIVSDNLTYIERNGAKIFERLNEITTDIDSLCNRLEVKGRAPFIKENYFGPVMFCYQAAAQAWLQGLFGYPDNLYAYREPLYNTSNKTMYYGQNMNSLETKINKPVIDKNFSIYDMSGLKQWAGTDLLGYYRVDAEGVVPVDSLILIENGVLKTLYNGRTPTRNVPISNGHMRFTFVNGAITSGIGPGNIFIKANEAYTEEKLTSILLEKAKEQGLDYAYIIRPNLRGNINTSLNLYRINVSTGEEKLVRGGMVKPLTINSLRRNVLASDRMYVYNGFLTDNLLSVDGGISIVQQSVPDGFPVSVICPSVLLIDDIELTFYNKSLTDEKPAVPRP